MTRADEYRAAFLADVEKLVPEDAALLDLVCEAMNRLDEVRIRVETDGLILTGSKGQPVPNPLLREERALRSEIVRLLRDLALEPDPRRAGDATAGGRALARTRWSPK